MASQARLRASDADRERIADRLRQASAEGRLLTEELEQRLGAAFAARTYGQLDELVADLPRPGTPARGRQRRVAALVPPMVGLAILIPIVVVAVAAVLFTVVGLVATWWVWIVVAWFAFGRRRHGLYGPPGWGGYAGTYSRRGRIPPGAGPRGSRRPPPRDYWA